jgi:hypothetical protein
MTPIEAVEHLALKDETVAAAYRLRRADDLAPGAYIASGTLAQVLAEVLLDGRLEDLVAVFKSLEGMLSTAEGETRELLIVGLLEDLQNISLSRDIALNEWVPLLGPGTTQAWDAIDEMWAGRMPPAEFNAFVASSPTQEVRAPRKRTANGIPWVFAAVAGLAVVAFAMWFLWAELFETPPRPENVVGSTWLVVELDGQTDLPRVTLSFAEEELTVWTGCRSVTEQWGFDTDGFLIGIGPIIASDPPCSGDAAELDSHILESLINVEGWHRTSTDALRLVGTLEPTELHLVRESTP